MKERTPLDCNSPEVVNAVDLALDKIQEALEAVQSCEGKLTEAGYKRLRGRLGHLMDTLYKVGAVLAEST